MALSDARPGKSSRDPLLLCACIRERYVQLREKAAEESIPTRLIETLRDSERQAFYIATGASWTTKSKHLPQSPYGLALAFDIAPEAYLALKGWAPGAAQWVRLGEIGEELGLGWGGLWKARDYPHFQLDECMCIAEPSILEA